MLREDHPQIPIQPLKSNLTAKPTAVAAALSTARSHLNIDNWRRKGQAVPFWRPDLATSCFILNKSMDQNMYIPSIDEEANFQVSTSDTAGLFLEINLFSRLRSLR